MNADTDTIPCEICDEPISFEHYGYHLKHCQFGNSWMVQLGCHPNMWWKEYDPSVQRQLDEARASGLNTYSFEIGKGTYIIDLRRNVQRAVHTGTERRIHAPCVTSKTASKEGVPVNITSQDSDLNAAIEVIPGGDASASSFAGASSCEVICVDDVHGQQMVQPCLTRPDNSASSSSAGVPASIVCKLCGASLRREEYADHIVAHELHSDMLDEDVDMSLEPENLVIRITKVAQEAARQLPRKGSSYSVGSSVHVLLPQEGWWHAAEIVQVIEGGNSYGVKLKNPHESDYRKVSSEDVLLIASEPREICNFDYAISFVKKSLDLAQIGHFDQTIATVYQRIDAQCATLDIDFSAENTCDVMICLAIAPKESLGAAIASQSFDHMMPLFVTSEQYNKILHEAAQAAALILRQAIDRVLGAPAPPSPSKEDMTPGTEWFISPLEIRFTHDVINSEFRPFYKDGQYHKHQSILDSVWEMLRSQNEPPQLRKIDVVWHNDQIYVAGTFNRRLCMYRLLAIFHPSRFGLITVRVQEITPQMKFQRKLSTKCEGRFVEVRQAGVKQWIVGQTREDLRWPEALQLLESHPTIDGAIGVSQESQSSDSTRPWKRRRVNGEPYATGFMRHRAGLCTDSAEALAVLDALVGTWHDTLGQMYKVTKNRETQRVDVETMRPDAKGDPSAFKNSAGLVRIERMESLSDFFQVVWGRDAQYVLDVEPLREWTDMNTARWLPRKGRKSTWHWTRSATTGPEV